MQLHAYYETNKSTQCYVTSMRAATERAHNSNSVFVFVCVCVCVCVSLTLGSTLRPVCP